MASKSFIFLGIGAAAVIAGIAGYAMLQDEIPSSSSDDMKSAEPQEAETAVPEEIETTTIEVLSEDEETTFNITFMDRREKIDDRLTSLAYMTRPIEPTLSPGETRSYNWIVGYFGEDPAKVKLSSESELIKIPESLTIHNQWASVEFIITVPDDYPSGEYPTVLRAFVEGDPGMVTVSTAATKDIIIKIL